MMADSGIYDQATIARRQKIAEQMLADDSKPPNIRSWAQGLSHLGNIGADVFSLNQLDKKKAAADQSSRDAMMELLNGAGGDQVPGPAPSAAPASSPTMAPPSPSVVNASAAPRIYDQSERNPLDPPAGADRDMLIRAIHGEAGNQGPEGMRAVASVIRNRAVDGGYGGDTYNQLRRVASLGRLAVPPLNLPIASPVAVYSIVRLSTWSGSCGNSGLRL